MYNPKSLKAEEFINHEEILDTIKYADENKDNVELLKEILEKAKLRKGLSHRDASVLLATENKEIISEVYSLAEQIKKDFYGNRIVLFAPLYLSNYCVNGCVYCPYHYDNKTICRKKLTQEEIKNEVKKIKLSITAYEHLEKWFPNKEFYYVTAQVQNKPIDSFEEIKKVICEKIARMIILEENSQHGNK